MRLLIDLWDKLFKWLSDNSAAHSTALLVFITAWYAALTYRMSKSLNRQTRAMVQPVIRIDFDVRKDEFYPKGRFEVKNLGAQPLLIINMRLECIVNSLRLFDSFLMYERHIVPPGESIAFVFDFTERYQKKGVTIWSPGFASFNLELVASDLGEETILTYLSNAYWQVLTVKKGMPLRVHWKHLSEPFKQRYTWIRYKLKSLEPKDPTEKPRRRKNPRKSGHQ